MTKDIDSALYQIYKIAEVIVVDGYAINLRYVINNYGNGIVPVFKKMMKRGQTPCNVLGSSEIINALQQNLTHKPFIYLQQGFKLVLMSFILI